MEMIRKQRDELAKEIDGNKESIEKIEMDIGLIKVQVLPLENIF